MERCQNESKWAWGWLAGRRERSPGCVAKSFQAVGLARRRPQAWVGRWVAHVGAWMQWRAHEPVPRPAAGEASAAPSIRKGKKVIVQSTCMAFIILRDVQMELWSIGGFVCAGAPLLRASMCLLPRARQPPELPCPHVGSQTAPRGQNPFLLLATPPWPVSNNNVRFPPGILGLWFRRALVMPEPVQPQGMCDPVVEAVWIIS
jgi:hypothetical protein